MRYRVSHNRSARHVRIRNTHEHKALNEWKDGMGLQTGRMADTRPGQTDAHALSRSETRMRLRKNYQSGGIHTLILTHVRDAEALAVGAVVGGPAQEELVARGAEGEGHGELAAQSRDARAVDVGS